MLAVEETLAPEEGEAALPDLHLPDFHAVWFEVQDEAGAPVWGATISRLPPVETAMRSLTVSTDPKGRTRVLLDLGLTEEQIGLTGFFVYADRKRLATTPPIDPRTQGDEPVRITLFHGETLRGTVSDASGVRLGGATVIVTQKGGDALGILKVGNQQWAPEMNVLLGVSHVRSDGTFRVNHLPPGPYEVAVRWNPVDAPPLIWGTEVESTAEPLELRYPGPELADERSTAVEIEVRDALTTNPVFQASVWLGLGPVRRRVPEWGPGIWRDGEVPDREWQVSIEARGHVPATAPLPAASSGVRRLLVALSKGGVLRGRALKSDGPFGPGASVYLTEQQSGRTIECFLVSGGVFEVPGLLPGAAYGVQVFEPGPGPGSWFAPESAGPVRVPKSGDPEPLEASFVPSATLIIETTSERATTGEAVQVTIEDPLGDVIWIQPVVWGTNAILHLRPGHSRLVIPLPDRVIRRELDLDPRVWELQKIAR
jgi:hypothetical protein